MLGVSKEAIVNNFGLYFINQLKAEFLGQRTAFLSSSGHSSWHEIDRIEKELVSFNNEVIVLTHFSKRYSARYVRETVNRKIPEFLKDKVYCFL